MSQKFQVGRTTSPELLTQVYSPQDQLEKICNEFETRLSNGVNPKLEDFLDRVATSERWVLLRKLVKIEYQYARHCGPADFSVYFDRFPESSDVLRSLRDELELAKFGQGITRIADPIGGDTVIDLTSSLPQIQRFQLSKKAGEGGFGTVWHAFDLKLKRQVAVKLPNQGAAATCNLAAIMNEAQTNAKLSHPNIVEVYDVDEASSAIVTRYIDGCNLKTWRGDRIVEPVPAVQLMVKLANAVQYAHINGVIHRDLKPSNVLMDLTGEPHIADFGLAKHEFGVDTLAMPGKVMGTLEYMAPEQARADHDAVERRSDIYSLGVILYELLTGRLPFRGEETLLLSQVIHNSPPDPRSINPRIPLDLSKICLKCLQKSPSDRYTHARELQDDLERYLEGEVIQGDTMPWHDHVTKWMRKHYNRARHLWIGLVAGVAMIAMFWWASLPAPLQQQVVIETDPPGCAITAVMLDPDTGEPDPGKIQVLRGRTPMKAKLLPGDYFIVAVLNPDRVEGNTPFIEVFRHVPDADEGASFARKHNVWRKDKAGRIVLPKITIPTSRTFAKMIYIDESQVESPTFYSKDPAFNPPIVNVPSFYTDENEVALQDTAHLGSRDVRVSAVSPFIKSRYDEAVAFAESEGKRLPFAAELAALEAAADRESPFGSTRISGVHSQLWEWTATRPAVAGKRELRRATLGDLESKTRIVRNGPLRNDSKQEQLWKVQIEHQVDSNTGFRMVRSAKPPQTSEDFMSLQKKTPTPAK